LEGDGAVAAPLLRVAPIRKARRKESDLGASRRRRSFVASRTVAMSGVYFPVEARSRALLRDRQSGRPSVVAVAEWRSDGAEPRGGDAPYGGSPDVHAILSGEVPSPVDAMRSAFPSP
jgi:hypothetical protein